MPESQPNFLEKVPKNSLEAQGARVLPYSMAIQLYNHWVQQSNIKRIERDDEIMVDGSSLFFHQTIGQSQLVLIADHKDTIIFVPREEFSGLPEILNYNISELSPKPVEIKDLRQRDLIAVNYFGKFVKARFCYTTNDFYLCCDLVDDVFQESKYMCLHTNVLGRISENKLL